MITYKTFEVRDSMTFIPMIALAIDTVLDSDICDGDYAEQFLIRNAGYGANRCILFGSLKGGTFSYDEYGHNDCRTRKIAHAYIQENWTTLKNGDVIDVQHILGESEVKCESDRYWRP